MSLLWRDRIGISISPNHVAMVRRPRGLRSCITGRVFERLDPVAGQSSSWRAALDRLDELLQRPEWRNADAVVVLSNHFVRYVSVPWHDEVREADERLALARHRFMQVFGDASQQWDIRLGGASEGVSNLASAVDGNLISGLKEVLGRSALELRSIQPYVMAGFNHCVAGVGSGDSWFVIAEPGCVGIALLHAAGWSHFQTRYYADSLELGKLLDREGLVCGLADYCPDVILFASEAENISIADPYRMKRIELPACRGYSPETDKQYAMAISGVI